MFIQLFHEILGFRLVVVVLVQRIAPGCQIIPPCPAGSLRVGSNDLHAFLDQVVPILNPLRVSFADEEHDRGRIRRAVLLVLLLPAFID
ncbi:hypothetical protein D1872_241740 [compost metagenome]